MPDHADRVFLVNPVTVYGTEVEGSAAALAADGSRTVPVVVIGPAVPEAGDLLLALALGGRWVAEVGSPFLPCSPCSIPQKTLTLTWANNALGTGSTPLEFDPPNQWISTCINQMTFQLGCSGKNAQLKVASFVSGDCSTGQSQVCVSSGSGATGILLSNFSCSPLLLEYEVSRTGCSALWASGYTGFTITE